MDRIMKQSMAFAELISRFRIPLKKNNLLEFYEKFCCGLLPYAVEEIPFEDLLIDYYTGGYNYDENI